MICMTDNLFAFESKSRMFLYYSHKFNYRHNLTWEKRIIQI